MQLNYRLKKCAIMTIGNSKMNYSLGKDILNNVNQIKIIFSYLAIIGIVLDQKLSVIL